MHFHVYASICAPIHLYTLFKLLYTCVCTYINVYVFYMGPIWTQWAQMSPNGPMGSNGPMGPNEPMGLNEPNVPK